MLTTKRPTQTTVLYTVSTRPANKTLTSHLGTSISILARITAGLLVLTSLLHEYTQTFAHPASPPAHLQHAAATTTTAAQHHHHHHPSIFPSSLGPMLEYLLNLTSRPGSLIFCFVTILLIFRKGHTEESLLVIRGLGVQTTTSSPNYLWGRSTRFIPTSLIQDVFIHEAFRGFEVRFYLSIVVEGEEDVVVVFPNILPRREILEQVWRGARACLYEPKSG